MHNFDRQGIINMNDDVDDDDGDDDDADDDGHDDNHDDCGDHRVAYHNDTMSVIRS